jgi:putative heme iron utilization protein
MGALSTIARDPAGYPFGSHVLCAVDEQGRPVMSLSDLAEHTRNAAQDPRASFLLTEAPAEGADPLSGARLTLIGDLVRLDEPELAPALAVFVEAHPGASYVRFPDFSVYRLEVGAVRFVGGFGTMSWVDAASYAEAASLLGAD